MLGVGMNLNRSANPKFIVVITGEKQDWPGEKQDWLQSSGQSSNQIKNFVNVAREDIYNVLVFNEDSPI